MATPDPAAYLLRELLVEIAPWNVRTEQAREETTGTGPRRAALQVEGREADTVGRMTQAPMSHRAEIGVFTGSGGGGERLYLRPATFEATTTRPRDRPREPARADS